MSWSETMLIIQHFYNVFDINERLEDVVNDLTSIEYKAPLMARSVNGLPQDVDIEKLTPGTLWFIQDDNEPSMMQGLSVFKDDKTFSTPVPFSVDLKHMTLDDTMQQIVSRMGLTANNYYDIIKVMLETLETVPVARGGTGKTSIAENHVLVGNSDGSFEEREIANEPLSESDSLITAGAVFESNKKLAKKSHASATDEYGLGSATKFGHVKITNDLATLGEDSEQTAPSVKALLELLESISSYFSLEKNEDREDSYTLTIK